MPSLDASYQMIGRILAKLILGGLSRQTIRWKEVLPTEHDGTESLEHFVDVMTWLENEGLIIHGPVITVDAFPQVQLTSRGIAAAEQTSFGGEKKSVRETIEQQPEGGLSGQDYSKA